MSNKDRMFTICTNRVLLNSPVKLWEDTDFYTPRVCSDHSDPFYFLGIPKFCIEEFENKYFLNLSSAIIAKVFYLEQVSSEEILTEFNKRTRKIYIGNNRPTMEEFLDKAAEIMEDIWTDLFYPNMIKAAQKKIHSKYIPKRPSIQEEPFDLAIL